MFLLACTVLLSFYGFAELGIGFGELASVVVRFVSEAPVSCYYTVLQCTWPCFRVVYHFFKWVLLCFTGYESSTLVLGVDKSTVYSLRDIDHFVHNKNVHTNGEDKESTTRFISHNTGIKVQSRSNNDVSLFRGSFSAEPSARRELHGHVTGVTGRY